MLDDISNLEGDYSDCQHDLTSMKSNRNDKLCNINCIDNQISIKKLEFNSDS